MSIEVRYVAECRCGWSDRGFTRDEVRQAYDEHKQAEHKRK